MTCQCCGKPRAEVHVKKSRLVPNMPLYLCNECIAEKHEPRFVIILKGRSSGPEEVMDVIIKKKYHGKEILFTEIMK